MTPEQFRNKRNKIGATQRKLAKDLNLGKNGYRTVQRYESGDINISGPVIRLMQYIEKYGPLDEEKPNDQ